ncbi:MAG: hypothetical protein ACQEXJ_14455 [Myxococcota bacterium]
MRTSPRLLAAAIAALWIGGVTGCDRSGPAADAPESKPAQPEPNPAPEPEPEPPKKDVADLVVGDTPRLPSVLDGVDLGMAREEVEEALPAMTEGGLLPAEDYEDVFVNLGFDPSTGRLLRVWFSLPADRGEELVTEAWGDPVVVEEFDEEKKVWFDPGEGIRAALSEGFGEGMELEFTRYLPAERMIGEGAAEVDPEAEGEDEDGEEPEPPGVPFAFEADHPLLDGTLESVRESWPRALQEQTAEQAEERLREIEELTGRKLEPSPEPTASVHLDLPPTEYGTFFTRVHLELNDDGEIVGYRFGLTYGNREGADEELLELLKARLGEAEKTERFGEEILVFREESPRVEVRRDEVGHQWDVTVEETSE